MNNWLAFFHPNGSETNLTATTEDRNYWREQLAYRSTLDLPLDLARKAEQTYRGAHVTVTLDDPVIAGVQTRSEQAQLPLAVSLLGVFKLLLQRYTLQEDVTVAIPRAAQDGTTNTLLLRTELRDDLGFDHLLAQLQATCQQAMLHQGCPVEALREELLTGAGGPLYQVMFQMQESATDAVDWLAPYRSGEAAGQPLQLLLTIRHEEQRWIADLEYNAELFAEETVARMLKHYQMLLAGVACMEEVPLATYTMVDADEYEQVIGAFNDTALAFPEVCLHELIEQQAEKTPDRVAVVYVDDQITYKELNERANQLAHYLRKHGVGQGSVVGICVERSVEMVIGMVGVLKAGAAYAPLDSFYPLERLAFMTNDLQLSVILLHDSLRDRLTIGDEQIVSFDRDRAAIAAEPTTNLANSNTPDDVCYLMYTSGSTGNPKGVLNTHRGTVNQILWLQHAYPLTPEDRVLQKAAFSFDCSVCEFYWPLVAGARLYVAPLSHQDDVVLHEMMVTWEITATHFTASRLRTFLELPNVQDCHMLHTVICSGEALDFELQNRYYEQLPHAKLHNLYGPTEAAVHVTAYTCPSEPKNHIVPIGVPVANTKIYILDKQQRPTPIRVPGELYIGGVQVASGYLNRPDLTEERFLADPFHEQPNMTMYKTGDLARFLPDGNVEFLGRIDQQVKIRGFRIEPGEIEGELAKHPAVRTSAVVAQQDTTESKRLVAYVVAHDVQNPPTPSELRAFLKERLPKFMLPGAYMMLGQMPMTPSGKINRRALPRLEAGIATSLEAYVAPRTPVEKLLASIWMELLKLERIGIHDNFFDLGADSIIGMQAIARANQAGLKLAQRHLYEKYTIAEMAAVCGELPQIDAEQGLVVGKSPLSIGQSAYLEAHGGALSAGVVVESFDLNVNLTPEQVQEIVFALMKQHDALRLQLREREIGWEQWYSAEIDERVVSTLDVQELDLEQQQQAIQAEAARLVEQIGLGDRPLFHVALVQKADGEAGLLVLIHSLLADEESWTILMDDLQTAMWQVSHGEPIVFPDKTTSFRSFAERVQTDASSAEHFEQLEECLQTGTDGEQHRLPRNTSMQSAWSCVRSEVSVAETKALLEEVTASYRTSAQEVLLAAVSMAVQKTWHVQDVLVEIASTGRETSFEDIDLSRSVGCFAAPSAMLLSLQATEPSEHVKGIKETVRAVSRQPYTARREVDLCFQYREHIRREGDRLFERSGERLWINPQGRSTRTALLDVDLWTDPNGMLHINWSYDAAQLPSKQIEQLQSHFAQALQELVARSQAPNNEAVAPSDFPLANLDSDMLSKLSQLIGR